MKQIRMIKIIPVLGFIALCMINMTGCGLFPDLDNTAGKAHVSKEEKDRALVKRKEWINNRIEYIPTPSPTPTPVPTPVPNIAAVACINKVYPLSVKKGESFNIGGLILTDTGTIDEVAGYFIAEDGTVVTEAHDKPGNGTYEIKHSIIDHQLAFGDLKPGEYICVIKARGSNFGETEVMRFNFKISTKTVLAAKPETPEPAKTVTEVSDSDTVSAATEKPEPAKVSARPLTEAEQEIADRIINAAYPKICRITATCKKSNDSGYEYYKIISKYDGKSVSIMQVYEDDTSDTAAEDCYITTVGNTVKKFVYIDGCGWRKETVNKAYLTPEGNKTAVSINLDKYFNNAAGGQWSLKATSSEYILNCTGIKSKSDTGISTDATITADKNYEIKYVNIVIRNANSAFRGEKGYRMEIAVEVADKDKTTVHVPEEVTTDIFDFEQYVANIVKEHHSDDGADANRDASGKVISFTYYDSEKGKYTTMTFDEAVKKYGLSKYK